jgi:antirestriction protein ArdC
MAEPQKPDTKDKPKRKPFHEEFAEKIIARLKEGTAPWQQPWHPGSANMAPHNPASGTVYKGVNRISLAMSGYDDPRWMTLKQANDQGMSILPGSKSSPVVYYQFTKEPAILILADIQY